MSNEGPQNHEIQKVNVQQSICSPRKSETSKMIHQSCWVCSWRRYIKGNEKEGINEVQNKTSKLIHLNYHLKSVMIWRRWSWAQKFLLGEQVLSRRTWVGLILSTPFTFSHDKLKKIFKLFSLSPPCYLPLKWGTTKRTSKYKAYTNLNRSLVGYQALDEPLKQL